MKQENKERLLIDISVKSPYGVKCAGWLNINNDEDVDKVYPYIDGEYIDGVTPNRIRIQGTWVKIEFVRPYLRPMSSMTREEENEICQFMKDYHLLPGANRAAIFCGEITDWLNKKMFDYRGLISKGLALEAPEGMY